MTEQVDAGSMIDPGTYLAMHEGIIDSEDEMNAFLGAIDDLFEEYTAIPKWQAVDESIMSRMSGLVDTASEYYSADMSQALLLMRAIGQRLGEIACQHDHFADIAARANGLFNDTDHNDHDHSHTEESDDDDHGDAVKKKKRAHQAFLAMFSLTLFGNKVSSSSTK